MLALHDTEDAPLIAVVDDDPVTRRLMSRLLEQAGFATVPHESGESLLDSDLRALSAVCLDLRLGEQSGMSVMAGLQRRDPTLPVLMVTAVREVEAAVGAMTAGAYDYIVKPVETSRLLAACRRAVERRELARRVEHLERSGAAPQLRPEDIVPLSEIERREIERALEATRGNVGAAARLLGIGRATLYRRLASYQEPYPRAGVG